MKKELPAARPPRLPCGKTFQDGKQENSRLAGKSGPKCSKDFEAVVSGHGCRGRTFEKLNTQEITMMGCCARLTSLVLKSRTDFAACLISAMKLQ